MAINLSQKVSYFPQTLLPVYPVFQEILGNLEDRKILSFPDESSIFKIFIPSHNAQGACITEMHKKKTFCQRFKKVIVSKPYFFPMFVDLIMTSITDAVFFGGDESHGDWHQSARTSRAPHRHNDLYPLKNTQISF